MSKAVKATGLGLVIFATVWVVTLWQWYSTQRSVTGQQVAMQLVVLPAALTAIALVAWWGATRLRSFATRPIEPPPAPSAPAQAGAANAADAPRGPSGALATVVSEAVALSAGHDVTTAWNGLRTGQVRPSLDSAVQDTEGLPVFTARLSDLDTADWLDAHAELSDGELPALPEAVVRSLALLEGPLHELLGALQGLQPPAEQRVAGPAAAASVSAAHLSGVGVTLSESDRSRAEQRVPALSVSLCLPSNWSEPDRQRALGWVRQRCGAMVDWMQAWGAREPHWQLESPATPEVLWEGLTQGLRRAHADPRPHLHLVLAADSLVDEDSVLRLLGRGELFTHQHQGGRVPGEAAVGLLLANPAWQAQSPLPDAPGLGWPVKARREQSADRIGRVGSEVVGALFRQALDSAAPNSAESNSAEPNSAEPPDTWWVVSDADHRASRCAELFEAVQAVQPGVDPLSSVIRAGDACGDMGLARALVPVALASSAVRQGLSPDEGNARPTPALVGLLQCSHSRVVIPVWPPTAVPVFPSV